MCEWIMHFVHTVVTNEYINNKVGCIVAVNGPGCIVVARANKTISKSWMCCGCQWTRCVVAAFARKVNKTWYRSYGSKIAAKTNRDLIALK
jgi:hypothetical protein